MLSVFNQLKNEWSISKMVLGDFSLFGAFLFVVTGMEERYSWNLLGCFGFDYLEFAMNPKMLGHFKTNSNYNLWLAYAVGLVGQKSCSHAFFFFFKISQF